MLFRFKRQWEIRTGTKYFKVEKKTLHKVRAPETAKEAAQGNGKASPCSSTFI
jgi:hypothetical protein